MGRLPPVTDGRDLIDGVALLSFNWSGVNMITG